MYAYIKGIVAEATPSKIVIEAQGIGFSLLIPLSNFSKLPSLGSPILLYTTCVIREDSQKLYGFLTQEEKNLFETLIDVSGVGPKTALGLIGHMEVHNLQQAIHQGNCALICKIPGIGKKTAERLVVELRDKIKKTLHSSSSTQHRNLPSTAEDALSALLNLGYNASQAQKAVKQVLSTHAEELPLATFITSALRSM